MPKDTKLYELLNVEATANENEVRKAYYKLAKVHHPDKITAEGGDKEAAEEKFKEIKFAYEVLSDKEKRDVYDRYGMEGLKDGVGGTEFEDIFSNLFGGMGGGGMGGGMGGFPFDMFGGGGMPGMGGMGGRGGRPQKRRTQNVVHPLKVTLEELYKGAVRHIEIERKQLCAACDGQGGKAGATKTCSACSGRGFVMAYKQIGPGMVQQMQSMCKECAGQGEILNEKDRCKVCMGRKTVKKTKKIEVNIDRGMQDSQKLTFRGESNQEPGVETGDLIVVLQQEEHDVFTVNHDDLFMTHTVNITEALCGFKLVVKHLDGRQLVLDHPVGEFLAPGSIRGVPNEGMPVYKNPYERGNLYIKFDVKFPEQNSISDEQISKLEKLLPPKAKFNKPTGDHVEEVSMIEYANTKGSSSGARGGRGGDPRRQMPAGFAEAFGGGGDDEDEEEQGGGAGQRVECNSH